MNRRTKAAMNATELGSALGVKHGDVSRRQHNWVARNKTRDTNLVCCAYQAILDTAALGVPNCLLDGALHLEGRQLLEAWENQPRSAVRSSAMFWFLAQLVLNAAWSQIFFGWHGPKGGSFIVALLLAIGTTIMFASRVDRVTAYLLIPYLAWVAYATTINAGVVALN